MELTGLEEHLRDEAWECGELAARRLEAEEEARKEAAAWEYEMEEARLAEGLPCLPATPGSACSRARSASECREDDIPF